MTWRHTGPGPAGTPRRPNRPTTTWPSNSGGSSSPPDFATHALARPPHKKPKPSSQPGPPPEHDQPKLRKTRGRPAVPKHRGTEDGLATRGRRRRPRGTPQSPPPRGTPSGGAGSRRSFGAPQTKPDPSFVAHPQ